MIEYQIGKCGDGEVVVADTDDGDEIEDTFQDQSIINKRIMGDEG